MVVEAPGGKSVCNLIWIAFNRVRDLDAYRGLCPGGEAMSAA